MELNKQGAHTLVAQSKHETSYGRSCYNWNLGNVKSPKTDVPHMYLRGTWEPLPTLDAKRKIAGSGGLARPATDAEIKQHQWHHGLDEVIVVCNPPDPYSRFRAYGSLEEGALKWVEGYKRKAVKHTDLLPALNRGDCVAFAKLLKQDHYYMGSESDYASNMTSIKKKVDLELGDK